jgi:hypothetical protein
LICSNNSAAATSGSSILDELAFNILIIGLPPLSLISAVIPTNETAYYARVFIAHIIAQIGKNEKNMLNVNTYVFWL